MSWYSGIEGKYTSFLDFTTHPKGFFTSKKLMKIPRYLDSSSIKLRVWLSFRTEEAFWTTYEMYLRIQGGTPAA